LGIFRFHVADKKNPEFFEASIDQKVSLMGRVVDEPEIREKDERFVVEVLEQDEEAKILVSTNLESDLKYGDKIKFSGVLKKPENFSTDQGKIFDYVNYLRKDGILYTISFANISSVQSGGFSLRGLLFKIKEKFLEKINFSISSPENSFMGGLILGEKSSFEETLRENFVKTGTIHVVALSGYNVSIVADWIMKIFSFLSVTASALSGALAILIFILMTGASSTAIRAGIMAGLALFARSTGRNYDAGRALLFSGVLMILINPLLLVFDVSFELSFMATFALIFFSPRIKKYFMWITEKFCLREIATTTTAVYIFVAPFILYKMGNFSLVALPANMLILPFIPPTMLLGFLTGVVGLIWYGFSVPFGFISYLFLHYELVVINFFASLPIASFNFPNFPLIFVVPIYIYFLFKIFKISIFSGTDFLKLKKS
jgi:competence protein ComEC